MMSMASDKPHIVFAHGKESGPWGSKILHLAAIAKQHGCTVESPDYQGIDDPRQRLAQLLKQAPTGSPLMLVGSSMGGYVSAMACESLRPACLLLMAPALYLDGYPGDPVACPDDTVVVHGWRDDTVPVGSSITFARPRGASLHLVDDGHRLAASIDFIGQCFTAQLRRCLGSF